MRRGQDHEISSLDLLLDTICNTFGGIVFIALLLALLARSAGQFEPTPQHLREQLEIMEMEQQAANLHDTIESLRAALAAMPDPDHAVEADSSVAELRRLQEDASSSRETAKEAGSLLAVERSQEASMKAEHDALAAELDNMRKRTEELSVIASRPRPMVEQRRLPVVQKVPPHLTPIWLGLFEGHLYVLEDERYVTIRAEPEQSIHEPIVGRGYRVLDGSDLSDTVRRALVKWRPERTWLLCIVDRRSFAEFAALSDYISSQGYRYMLHIYSPPYAFIAGRPDEAM